MERTIRNEDDKQAVIDYISSLDVAKREYEAKIVKKTDKRTLAQNRLYRLWLNCISEETGNDVEDLHEYFKAKYIGVHYRVIYGEGITRNYSTTDLSTEQFTEFLERVQRWANIEQGIVLPNPEDLQFAQFLEKYQNNL